MRVVSLWLISFCHKTALLEKNYRVYIEFNFLLVSCLDVEFLRRPIVRK